MSTSLRRPGAVVALPLALGLLLGCGQDTDAADDAGYESTSPSPSSASPSSSSQPPSPSAGESEAAVGQSGPIEVTGDAGVERAVVVAGSDVGGDVSLLAFPLATEQEVADFGVSFDRGFTREVGRAVGALDAPTGTTPWGTVVAVGCEGPESVRIDAGEAGFEVTPTMPENTVQCLVPLTYVVVFAA